MEYHPRNRPPEGYPVHIITKRGPPIPINEIREGLRQAEESYNILKRRRDAWIESLDVEHLPSQQLAGIVANTREGKRLWVEYLRLFASKMTNPTLARMNVHLACFTGALHEELSDEDFTTLAAEYWKLRKPEEAAPPAGPVQRPDWLTQKMIDGLMEYYAANGETITGNEAVMAWTQFLDYTRELADLEKGGQDEDEDRAAED